MGHVDSTFSLSLLQYYLNTYIQQDSVLWDILHLAKDRGRQANFAIPLRKQSCSFVAEERVEEQAEQVVIERFAVVVSSLLSLAIRCRGMIVPQLHHMCFTSCTNTVLVDSPCQPRLLLALIRNRACRSTTEKTSLVQQKASEDEKPYAFER